MTNIKNTIKRNITVGILAHVDSGKTTLSESLLYKSGNVRKIGRVDHGDAFLDTHFLEKERGITIFSKQAVLDYNETRIFLLDTPGHIDFSAEMERTLKILDYALLVVNGSSSIQNHTFTLWKLLKKYRIPTFLFVNKMDMSDRDKEEIINELCTKLKGEFIDFTNEDKSQYYENIAACDENLMEKYLDGKEITNKDISLAIINEKLIPVYFGSALKLKGIEDLLDGISNFTCANEKEYEKETSEMKYSGKVYKISVGDNGERLTHIKITDGILHLKDTIKIGNIEEKINQIRIYSGSKYEMVNEAYKGMVVEVTGLTKSFAGMGFGKNENDMEMDTEPVLRVSIVLKEGEDVLKVYNTIKILNDEDPSLNISWNNTTKEIEVELMGEIQTEILKSIIKDRFDIDVEFGKGKIIYKETINEEVVGIGHYEPLKHYAEVHLLMRPLKRGEGIKVSSKVSVDVLDRNWQRLIETHIKEKQHIGVLTGSEITDIEFVIIAGKAHKKHTEGGDFRQATYRAIRQGLMKAKSVLLEPFYQFQLEIPDQCIGRAMVDLERMKSKFESPVIENDTAIITGKAPVAKMMGYHMEVASYTKGKGRLITSFTGYEECQNQDEIVENMGYNPLEDIENTPNSVFCANGAGYVVNYDEVEKYMHIDSMNIDSMNTDSTYIDSMYIDSMYTDNDEYTSSAGKIKESKINDKNNLNGESGHGISDKELEEIFERTYGKKKERVGNNYTNFSGDVKANTGKKEVRYKESEKKEKYLLVDGYNVIFAWEELSSLAKENIDAARDKLIDILCNYQGVKGCKIIVVFDAYKVPENKGSISRYYNIYVVYTKEAQTADAYIERFTHENSNKYDITVATSDGLEQVIIRGAGCMLISSRELKVEIDSMLKEAKEEFARKIWEKKGKVYLFDSLDEEFQKYLEDIRLGKR